MSATRVKAYEARCAIEDGAAEIDMVINVGALKDKKDDVVREDIAAVKEVCDGKALLKVIIETCLLNDEEKERACRLAVEAGADFVKTSTGFSTGGARVEDVALMKRTVDGRAKVKASGGNPQRRRCPCHGGRRSRPAGNERYGGHHYRGVRGPAVLGEEVFVCVQILMVFGKICGL